MPEKKSFDIRHAVILALGSSEKCHKKNKRNI